MTARKLRLAALVLVLLAAGARGQEAAEPQPGARRARPPAAARPAPSRQAAEDRAFLTQLGEAQRALGDQMQQLRERLDWLYYEVTLRRDEHAALEHEVKAMRDEVKGLYVENSSLRQQIDSLREDVAAVDANVSGFRTFSGFFIAAMILLLAVIFVLTIRR
jgi:predicted RNase H-like nuclease (RuvC/YqgF family)